MSGTITNGSNGSEPTISKKKKNESGFDDRQLLAALRALKRGDFAARLPDDLPGISGQICETFNDIVETAGSIGTEVVELRENVVRQGRTRRRIKKAYRGQWSDYAVCINDIVEELTVHADDVSRVVHAIGTGDLTARIDLDGREEPL